MKTVKIIIDKKGNYSVETPEGFTGNSCTTAVDSLVACIGGNLKEHKDSDDMFKKEALDTFITGDY